MNVLINSTVLSNFAATERLPLLQRLYGEVYLAQPVYEETQDGLEEGYSFLAVLDQFIFPFHGDGWLHLVNLEGEAEFRIYQQVPPKLHRGEAVSIVIAVHRGWRFLTDDQAARRYAKTLGVDVSGTLGILVQLVKRNIVPLTEANSLLRQMKHLARYHRPINDIGSLLP